MVGISCEGRTFATLIVEALRLASRLLFELFGGWKGDSMSDVRGCAHVPAAEAVKVGGKPPDRGIGIVLRRIG